MKQQRANVSIFERLVSPLKKKSNQQKEELTKQLILELRIKKKPKLA